MACFFDLNKWNKWRHDKISYTEKLNFILSSYMAKIPDLFSWDRWMKLLDQTVVSSPLERVYVTWARKPKSNTLDHQKTKCFHHFWS